MQVSFLVQILRVKPVKALSSHGPRPKQMIYGTVKFFKDLAILFQACISQQRIPDALCAFLRKIKTEIL